MHNPSEITAKKKRPRTPKESATRIRRANIGRMYRRCLTVLTREIERLMILSHAGALEPADGKLLLDYLKYVTELKAIEELEKLEKK